jgi:chromosome segregation ATPase
MSEMPGVDPTDRHSLDDQEPKKRRNPWIWVSVVLGLVAVGLLVWALTTQSDLDNAEQEAEAAQAQVEQGKKTGGAVLVGGKAAYDEVTEELGATTDDLDATEKDLQNAQKDADQAEQKAKAAEQDAAQADNEADKAKAETDKARAETEAAESKAVIAADCAKAYVSALGMLFEGESVKAQAEAVKQQLDSISATCKASLEGA